MTETTNRTTPNEAAAPTGSTGLRLGLGIGGLLAVVLGCIILFNPVAAAASVAGILAACIAVYAIVIGVVYIATSIFSGSGTGWARIGHALLGLVYLAAGIIMLSNLLASSALLIVLITVTVGIAWVIEGIVALSLLGRRRGGRVWTVIFAVLSLLAGVNLMFSPLLGGIVLWIMLGISLVVLGVLQVVRAFLLRADSRVGE